MDGLPLSNLEQGDDLGDPFSKAWEKGIGRLIDEPQGMFVERYLRGDMAIVLRLREPAGSGETIQDGLIIHLPVETHEPPAACRAKLII
jgi:hypothetical protein